MDKTRSVEPSHICVSLQMERIDLTWSFPHGHFVFVLHDVLQLEIAVLGTQALHIGSI